jgi:hypothetical protein
MGTRRCGKAAGAADHMWRKGKGGRGGAATAPAGEAPEAATEAAKWGGACRWEEDEQWAFGGLEDDLLIHLLEVI